VSARVVGALALAAAGPILWMFASRFRQLYELWKIDDNYSHGFLVPAAGAYLAWTAFRRLGPPAKPSYALGGVILLLGCVLRLAAVVVPLPLADFLALAVLLFGLAVLVGGLRWGSGFLFPILVLGFMFPLPTAVDVQLAVWLQQLVTVVSTWVLQLFIPAYHDGGRLVLPGHPLEVGEQCSGLRQVVAFAFLTMLVAYFSGRRWPFRVGIIVAGVPVAIVANVLRVLLMATLTLNFGAEAISEEKVVAFGISYHTAWGLLTMVVGLGLLAAIAWWLGRVFPDPDASGDAAATAAPAAASAGPLPRPLMYCLGGAVVGLALTGLLQQKLVAHLMQADQLATGSEYLTRPLQGATGVPVSLGAWDGKDSPPDPPTRPYYNAADDRLNRIYTLDDDSPERGLTCQLWMIHYRDATDRRHFPTTCYLHHGCQEEVDQRREVDVPGGAPVEKFCFTKPADGVYVSNVYYWHYTLEPPDTIPLSFLQRVYQAWCVRRPSLTVQVFTTAKTPEQLARVDEFVRLVDAELHAHLPPGARRGSESLPVTELRAPRTATKQ
jgi:exosortase